MLAAYLVRLLEGGYTRLSLDATDKPLMLTVYGPDGKPHHFPGKDTEDAVRRACIALCSPKPIMSEEY